jgi:hypothetical protein
MMIILLDYLKMIKQQSRKGKGGAGVKAEITKEEYAKIEARAIRRTAILCNHEHRRKYLSSYRYLLKNESGDAEIEAYKKRAKNKIKRNYPDMYCYECNCVPNSEYMIEAINKIIADKDAL